MNQFFKSYTPRHRIKTFTIDGDPLFDLSDDIASLSTNKAYGRCSGTWQIMLPYKRPKGQNLFYHELLVPDDLITIELDPGDGTGYQHVMTGLIDRISVVRQGGIAPQRSIKISGRDLGKLLEKHDITYDYIQYTEIMKLQETTGETTKDTNVRINQPGYGDGTAAEIVRFMFEKAFEGKLKASNRFDLINNTDDDWTINQPNLMSQSGTSFWQYITQIENKPYNTLHTDSNPREVGKFVIWLEKTPYDDNGKTDRPDHKTITIDDTEIVSDDLGISDNERVNMLFHPSTVYYSTSEQGRNMWVINNSTYDGTEEIKKHGLCNHTISTLFTPPSVTSTIDKDAEAKAESPIRTRQELFFRWYKNNHEYIAGSITLHLRPDIRAGWQLLVKDRNTDKYISYLVEQVAHQYVIHPSPQFTTTLHVTRGQYTTPVQKEMVKPKPEPPPPPDPKPEPPPPKSYDCKAAKAKIDGIRADYLKVKNDYNKRVAAWRSAGSEPGAEADALVDEKKKIDELGKSWGKDINATVDEAQANGCTNITDAMRSPPAK